VLLIEQINRSAPPVFSRAEQLAWLDRIEPPPGSCRAFYLVPGLAPAEKIWWVHQSDAMLVATRFGIPTVNGNSSVHPVNWRLNDPLGAGYAQHLRDWVVAKQVAAGLCGLEPRSGRWIEGGP
jgi:hypothetical protein